LGKNERKRDALYLYLGSQSDGLNCMRIQAFIVGELLTNCYVVHSQNTREAIVIDPGFNYPFEGDQIFQYISVEELRVKLILNTHGHSDHVSGDRAMQKRYHVPVYIHEFDAHLLNETNESDSVPNVILEDGSLVEFGDATLKVIHTPGHTKGSVCLLAENLIFTGDTLFAGGIGRTDFPGSSHSYMISSLKKLQLLPDWLVVYPGHGPSTTIGEEKRNNPFLL
jgi:hydroxyacylglutathione hydrolase